MVSWENLQLAPLLAPFRPARGLGDWVVTTEDLVAAMIPMKLVHRSRLSSDFAAVMSYADFLRLYDIPFFFHFTLFGIRLPNRSGSLPEIELLARVLLRI